MLNGNAPNCSTFDATMDQATSRFHSTDRIKNRDREALSLLFDRHRRQFAVLAHYRLGPFLCGLAGIDDIFRGILLKAYMQVDQLT